ncbi:cytochrome C assembly family protein [Alkalihalobacillus hemicellulosilyticus]|uniref:Negative effector of steady-state concentration of glutamyl-tRNA reductase n=1 Tax=Halalkalibacter hemicellulosilyticusJCM 9152 TaxID=1236971 RepID=W4QDR8_9BACI|nr:cytochrome c biogenesis protein CcsA [Halalkalibacter hemicellulosilyticus]GAE30200.1 negative effector of steady-state concentration of glutamyl-tRNA reductase [Halalkalibacter hemicellulosilyticusJCM 9152]
MNWIYPIAIVLYSFSVFGYFIDFLQNNRKVNRMAFWLLSIVWVLQTTFFVMRLFELGRVPLLTPFEGLFFYAWLIVTLSLVINWYFRVDFLVFFTNVIGFSMMTFSLFTPDQDVPLALSELLASELLIIHISIIMLSYAGFTVAFACQLLYVIQHHMLKKKKWGKQLVRFGALSKLDSISFFSILGAWPFLLIGLILGFVWGYSQLGQIPLLDAKVISSLFVLFIYGVYLYLRVVKLIRGYNMALLAIASFLILLINYFLSGQYSNFHIWY